MHLHLKGKTALVTGSSRGIGFAIAKCLAEEGATVILTGRTTSSLNDATEAFTEANLPFTSYRCDLTNNKSVTAIADAIEKDHGKLDILVCNLGSGTSVPPLTEDIDEWHNVMAINLFSSVATTQSLLTLLKKTASKDSQPAITYISSICSNEALGCPLAYAAAKSAITNYAQNIARPLGAHNIRVNVVSPGNILFKGSVWERKLAENPDAVNQMLKQEVPLQRLGRAQEIADMVTFLSSERASFITGAHLVVDGGQSRAT